MPAILDVRGLPETRALLASYQGRELQNRLRRGARAGIAEFRTGLRAEAAAGDYPRSFRKTRTRTTTRGGPSGREIQAYVRPTSPLFNIFGPGADPHTIAPGSSVTGRRGRSGGRPRKPQLAGPAGGSTWTNEGRKRSGAFFSSKPVRHPGMAPRPLLERAFNARLGRAQDAIAAAIFGTSTSAPTGILE